MGFITGSNIRVLLSASALALFASLTVAHASSFKVLHSFSGNTDGCLPDGGVVLDSAGNLYGVTAGGGGGLCGGGGSKGTVFELEPDGTEIILHAFTGGSNGQGPDDTLVLDKKGNLYGATIAGGSIGCGVIFKVAPDGTEKTFHDFAGGPSDGCTPEGALITDANGEFYGTTSGGGKDGVGTVFKLAQDGTETTLHSFNHKRSGFSPFAGLIMDANGNLYGADAGGGRKNDGTVFKIAPDGAETVLYAFKGPPSDGSVPDGTLITDQSGNFYGAFRDGGLSGCEGNEGCGAVYKLAPDGVETILHFFTGKHGDGGNSDAGLIADSQGNFYATTYYGGGSCTIDVYGCGTVFKVAPDGTETILYSFSKNNGVNGAFPIAGLVSDALGNLYGTASGGGQYGYGTVFEITP